MLSSFKKPRKNASAAKQQKVNVAKKLAARPVSPPSSGTDADSDSDSEYEEILISSLNGKPQKKQVLAPQVASVKPPEPVDDASHANHFTEPPVEEPLAKPSAPIPIPPRKRAKSKKVVIKKYYQKKVQDTPTDPTPATPAPARTSYIGISSVGTQQRKTTTNAHATMSSRILNW